MSGCSRCSCSAPRAFLLGLGVGAIGLFGVLLWVWIRWLVKVRIQMAR